MQLSPECAKAQGGKHGARRRIENFVGEKSVGSTRSAAVLAQVRRVQGSDPPLREFRECCHKYEK
ncbi:MAG: hypothetical protein ABI690_24630 [Chloroflexota bacterium]